MTKQAKWVMCPVCDDVVYGGPGMNQIERECKCRATVVIPLKDRGLVRWNGAAYKQAAIDRGQKTANRILREAATAEAEKLTNLGFDEEQVREGAKEAMVRARPEAEAAQKYEVENFPTEPEVEWTEEELSPMATRVYVEEQSLDDIITGQVNTLAERGEL